MKLGKKLIAAGLLALVLVAIYSFTPLGDLLQPERIALYRENLLDLVETQLAGAALLFILAYTLVTGLSIPGATVMTLLGGFLFGPWLGTFFVNIGATLGASVVFLAARYFLGRDIQNKYADKLERFNSELKKNGKNYMITLRLIPLFPFFLINLLAGFTALPLGTFLWTTSLGIIPGSFVYAFLGSTGASLGDSDEFRIRITIALVLLGLISILPTVLRKISKRRNNENNS